MKLLTKFDARDLAVIVIAALAVTTLLVLPPSAVPLAAPMVAIVHGALIALVLRTRR